MSLLHRPVRHWVLAAVCLTAAIFLLDAVWIPVKAEIAQHLLERSWLRALEGETNAKPWPWADTWPVARMHTADEELYILEGAQGNSLAFGPGHLQGSVLPGKKGISIIGGHRDTHFRFLEQIEH